MGDGFAAVGAAVDDGAEAVVPAELGGELGDEGHHVAEQGGVFGGGFADADDELLGDEQEMGGGLGGNVVDDDAFVVFVLDGGRDLAVDDFLEDCFHGEGGWVVGNLAVGGWLCWSPVDRVVFDRGARPLPTCPLGTADATLIDDEV